MRRWAVWIAGAAGALALAKLVVPKSSEAPNRRREASTIAAIRDTVESLQDSIVKLSLARDRFSAYDIAARLPRARAGFSVSADRQVPAAVVEKFASAARAQLEGLDSLATPVRLHLVADTARGGQYYRTVVLPTSTEEPCTAVIVLSARGVLHRAEPMPRDRLLGTCGFYARFGPAGPGVTAWLARTGGVYARGDLALASPAEQQNPREALDLWVVGRNPLSASCAARRLESCARLWSSGGGWASRQVDTSAVTASVRHVHRTAPWSTYFYPGTSLAELRGLIGDTRFLALWRHAEEPAAAYEALEGKSIGEVTYAMMMRELQPHEPGPLRAGLPLVLGLVVGAAAAFWGIARAPRQRSE